jgi:hypothetical protein
MTKETASAKSDLTKITESLGSTSATDIKTHAADEMAAVGKTFQLRSEKPTEPPNYDQAFAQLDVPNTSVGNPDFTAELKDEGKLGLFLTRDRARRAPVAVTMNVTNYHSGMVRTIRDSMIHLLQSKTEFNDADIEERIANVAEQLANGACVTTYLKLRALIYIELPDLYDIAYLKRPKAITDLPVVAPFAFAIQQLGAVNIANLDREARYVPVLPDTGHAFGVPTGYSWNPNKYAQAVDYARKIGLHFNVVDLKQKSGTAWWLLRQHYEEEIFELKLPFPEVNFTSAMAVTHTLFLRGHEDNPSNGIFNLTPCGNDDYGYILRDPHFGINVSTFETIDDSAKEIVSNV